MTDDSLVGKHKTEVETPALLLDMDAAERNITRMAAFFRDRDCKLRPHYKTHKLPLIAHKQMAAGAIGITCAKLGEAEVLLRSGIPSVLIANEIVEDSKIARLVEFARLGELIVCVDDYENARRISEAAGTAGGKINILVEVNVGLDRCGVAPGVPTVGFVKQVSTLEHLSFRGLMGYEGGMFLSDDREKEKRCRECNARLVETADMVREAGFPVEIVSAGGSNTYHLTGTYPGITEIQPGSYVTMDGHNRAFGLDFEQAVTVLATVISRPERDRIITDAGKKAISVDEGLPEVARPGLSLYRLDEEHSRVTVEDGAPEVPVGSKLEIIPSHGCTTIPLHDRYNITRGGYVESVAAIQPRQAL